MRHLTALAALAAFLAAGGSASRAQTPAPEQIAAQVQARYDKVRDFTADFVHVYEGGILRQKRTETGVLQVKKPGRMRWEYRKPDRKLFVSDGTQMYLYDEAENHVTIFPVPRGDEAATAALFLAGKGHITRDFTVAAAEGGSADTYMLRLTPRSPEPDYDWLLLEVDRQSFQMRSLSAADNQGGRNTFRFTNLRENTGLADRAFNFTIPRGADVVRADTSR